jgi:SPP1 gp7 family putative phage head morphogenesis protein
MNWGAHKADVRIAAKNSVTMRAALRASINAQAIYEAYQDTQPFVTDNNAQDRARARAWAMLHVKIDPEPIKAALTKIYTDGFLLGLDASKEAIGQAERTQGKAALTKSEDSDYVDWANWKPGNRAASLLYRPTGAFKTILDNAGIVSKTIAKAGYDRIGTALSDSVAAGFSPARAAKVITEKIGDPARALTIAITEQNRAMSLAAMQNYRENGVERVEWSGAMPCDICAPNEGQVVPTGEAFNSGDTEPPVHPNCRCAILPVINDEFYEETQGGMNLLPILDGAAEEEEPETDRYLTGRDLKVLGREQAIQLGELSFDDSRALHSYKGIDYMRINGYLREGEGVFKLGQDPIENARILKIWNDRIDRIQGRIEATRPITESFVTYRGVSGKFADQVWESAPGSVFQDRGFASTTTSKATAKEFGGKTQLHITNPVGSKGLAIEEVIDVEKSLKEYEWLLPKDTKFEIVSKEETEIEDRWIRIIKVRVVK